MRYSSLFVPAALVLITAMPGCSNESASPDESASSETALSRPSTDSALVSSLQKALRGTQYVSESEYDWSALVSDARDAGEVTTAAVVEHLGRSIEALDRKLNKDLAPRTIAHLTVKEFETFDELFARLEDGGENVEQAYVKARRIMQSNLTGLRVFSFDVTPNGDQVTGPVILVVVGKSASGRLIALTTFEVAT